MFKKIALISLITCFLLGSVVIIGWIGFQEKFRLLAQSFKQEVNNDSGAEAGASQTSALLDHTVIETKAEAETVVNELETHLSTLESEDLPED